ncbi:Molybdenum cofactor biosynthesis protein B, partial [Dysosmobacter welbionis]
RFYYVEPYHGKRLSNQLWTLGQAIWSHSVVEAVYRTQQGERKSRRLQPVGLLFSEFYFYLTAFIEGIDRAEHFENADDPFPTIYRVDRIEKLQVLDEHFQVPYSRRFSEGEFRKRVQFMYGGKLETVRFIYKGPSVEAVLDRLSTAEILSEHDGCYEIRAEVFGKG